MQNNRKATIKKIRYFLLQLQTESNDYYKGDGGYRKPQPRKRKSPALSERRPNFLVKCNNHSFCYRNKQEYSVTERKWKEQWSKESRTHWYDCMNLQNERKKKRGNKKDRQTDRWLYSSTLILYHYLCFRTTEHIDIFSSLRQSFHTDLALESSTRHNTGWYCNWKKSQLTLCPHQTGILTATMMALDLQEAAM